MTKPYVAKNGILSVPADAIKLIQGPQTSLAVSVLEDATETGYGRVLAIGDKELLADAYQQAYSDNATLNLNVANWALHPPTVISGRVNLALFVGDPTGVPLTLKLYSGSTLVQMLSTTLDGSGAYAVKPASAGTYTLVAKARQWLSQRQTAVPVSGLTFVDWDMQFNGDANNDNAVNLPDLSVVLANFNLTGSNDGDLDGSKSVNLRDISIVLSDFNLQGQ